MTVKRNKDYNPAFSGLTPKLRGFKLPCEYSAEGQAIINYSILLPLSGSNGSTTITDSSAFAHTATANGNAQISTVQSVSDGSSLLLDGDGDYIVFGPSAAFTLGTGDFEVACDIYPLTITGNDGIFEISDTPGGGGSNGSALTLSIFSSSLSISSGGGLHTPTLNAWQRIRIARFGGSLHLAVNGTEVWSNSNSINYIGTYLNLGLYFGTPYTFHGYIDNFAITKGELIEAWPS